MNKLTKVSIIVLDILLLNITRYAIKTRKTIEKTANLKMGRERRKELIFSYQAINTIIISVKQNKNVLPELQDSEVVFSKF